MSALAALQSGDFKNYNDGLHSQASPGGQVSLTGQNRK